MKLLKEEEPGKYQAHFSGLLKEGFEADDLAEMYTSVHAAICADPSAQLTEKNLLLRRKCELLPPDIALLNCEYIWCHICIQWLSFFWGG
jgi:hypothetical protein